jgi:cytidylate kinase
VEAEMARRDRNDSSRELAPLKPAPDALRIDSTNLAPQEVVDKMLAAVRSADAKPAAAPESGPGHRR